MKTYDSERVIELEYLIADLKVFVEWIEILGRTECEIYKHELKGNADLALSRIEKVVGY